MQRYANDTTLGLDVEERLWDKNMNSRLVVSRNRYEIAERRVVVMVRPESDTRSLSYGQ